MPTQEDLSIGLAKEYKTLTDGFCNAMGDGSEGLQQMYVQ